MGGSRRSSASSSASSGRSSIPGDLQDGVEEDEKTLVCMFMYSVKLTKTTRGVRTLAAGPALQATLTAAQQRQRQPVGRKPAASCISYVAFCPTKRRLYYGQSNGELCFWPLSETGCGTSRYVGSHKGPISYICIPPTRGAERSILSAGGLFLSGAVGGDIKIWDYQGKVTLEPTIVVQTLHGHSGTITSIFVHGNNIISSSTDSTVRVWKAVEGRGQLLYPWYDLQSVVVTVNGWARSMTYDRSKEVGDVGTFFVSDETGGVTRIIPNNRLALENENAANRGCPFVVNNQLPKGLSGSSSSASRTSSSAIPCMHDHGVAALRFVGDWRLLLALCYDNCLRAYDTDTGNCKFVQTNENRCMFTSLEVDGKNGEVLAVDKLGSLFIFCMNTGELIASKKLIKSPIVQICAVLGRELYAVATEQDISVWSIQHEHEYTKLRGGHTRAVVALHACSGGKGVCGDPTGSGNEADYRVLSASTDGTMRVWDPYDMSCMRVLHQEFSEISAMTFHEAIDLLITGHDNGDVHLWDMSSGSSQLLRQHTNAVTTVLLVLMKRNEEMLITTGYDGMVIIWDILNLRTQPPHMILKFQASGNPQSNLLMRRGSLETDLSSCPSSSRELQFMPEDPCCPRNEQAEALSGIWAALDLEPEVLAAAFEARRRVIFTAGNDRLIRVWSFMGSYLGQHMGHTDSVACLALDANFLFSGSEDCTIQLWDAVPASSKNPTPMSVGAGSLTRAANSSVQPDLHSQPKLGFTSSPLKVLHGHTRCVTALLTHPSAGHLFSCSLDGSLRVWDYVTGTVLLKYGHHEELKCIALRADCPEILVGTNQASILRYSTRLPESEGQSNQEPGASVTQGTAKPVEAQVPSAASSCTHLHSVVTEEEEDDDEEVVAAKRAAAKESKRWRYGVTKVLLPVTNGGRLW